MTRNSAKKDIKKWVTALRKNKTNGIEVVLEGGHYKFYHQGVYVESISSTPSDGSRALLNGKKQLIVAIRRKKNERSNSVKD